MSIRVAIRHTTKYTYERHIELSPQVVRLRPAPHTRTPIKGYTLHIEPDDHFINWQQDPFGNYLARLVFPNKVKEFVVDVEVIADMVVINPFDFFVEEYVDSFPFSYPESLQKELNPYLEITDEGPLVDAWVEDSKSFLKEELSTIDFLVKVNQKLQSDITYQIRMEHGVQTCQETLTKCSGSCRDSAWLLVQIFRRFGLAARFTSGYLVQLKADVESLDGPSGATEDFTDLHAWTEVFLPGAGWVGLDPTSGLFAGEGHIPLACTPTPQSAAPISGLAEPCETTFFFENKVTRIDEKPRVTKPYTESQWDQIVHLGHQVEEDLQKNNVRLTMGGEPTFVSIDNQDADEWNSGADGAHKRKLANQLFRRLKDAYGNGPLIQYGQGKWYPGEPLPRWKLASYWRKDGRPIWQDDNYLANLSEDYGFQSNDAHTFLIALAEKLNIDRKYIQSAFEDPFYFIWEEQKVPSDIDPLEFDLDNSLERQKLAEILQRGLSVPAGFVLPLRRHPKVSGWQTCTWDLRQKRLLLTPGNSPVGLRLPLDSIHETEEQKQLLLDGRDPFATEPKEIKLDISDAPEDYYISDETFKTALVTEVRDGKLFVFLPPMVTLEDYLLLIKNIEETAKAIGKPILIEGYDPPSDDRIQKFMVTPDPGVIEVNVHPCATWDELLNNFDVLFEAAAQSRLTTEKFNLDGRHTGTGGGNHITLGGKTPSESPLLRRPDLLRSLITFWQHHPSLSYLFSTQFIGPTSQAPRVDEGRDEMLYELELAFQQVPSREEDKVPYWLVDRLFRNLLIDLTGNTHRAEFCIDKLYSPDSSSGRLGILEFRGFDMPPHYRMCMVQFLLIRSLVSAFWDKPYEHKLVRWGTELHDRFLLPHYCQQDLSQVVEYLQNAGYAFDLDWFKPFFSFRFPFLGELQVDDIHVELRVAIEPWHVLGEEMGNMGTARYVDSSLERIQVKISGLTDSRYQLLCNGHRIPLQKTGTHGVYVAGIRYRAWQPPSALHPMLGIDTPLVFDLYDTWTEKNIAACKYHVAHPGGRSYDTFPVNSYEAESRRISRFFDYGHTVNLVEPTVPLMNAGGRFVTKMYQPSSQGPGTEIISPEYPHTMDLRMYRVLKK